MTKPKAPEIRSRFNWIGIAREVEFQRVRKGFSIKEIADATKIPSASWYKKGGGRKGQPPRTPFTVEELGKIAEFLGAPGLWPFEVWRYGSDDEQ